MSADAEWEAWVDHIRTDTIPKMIDSAFVVSLVPEGDTDIKFAVELGLCIMLDKPILAVVPPGVKVSDKLAAIADIIIVGNPGDLGFDDRLRAAITDLRGRMP